MQARHMPPPGASDPDPGAAAPGVLLVGQSPAALQVLAAHVQATLPKAHIHMLASTTELAFALASQDVQLVIIDSAHLDQTPPSLLSLSRGASRALRLAIVGANEASPHAVSAEALPAWLRSARAKAQP
jgi:hypothetical protein